ncbi:MAG: biopolymer transporter ExbD [Planctomycetota bacterium]|nr:biopolymer transporter ExbD [Planctomycetota bacterium]MCX8039527.1 biopolymer transporter ExbD [Planctomycetota bacterium]MDW8373332.1 biopolymer transporter ExbD [Planctomycetota bacterium]
MSRWRRRRGEARPLELNVIPLVDVVFFLLIFYVMSTVFERETALALERPASAQARAVASDFVAVAIAADGRIAVAGRSLELAELPTAVAAALAARRTATVVVIPDQRVPIGTLLAVMDACSAGGAAEVEVAAVAGAAR